jgi:hypothetical protein
MFLFIGLIMGGFLGYTLNNIIKRLNAGCRLKIVGYNVYIGKEKIEEDPKVIKMEKKEKDPAAAKVENEKCKTCNNEDMYIKGTKNLIPCPKCKRNSNKFRAPVKLRGHSL